MLPKSKLEHGGLHAIHRRRSRRPLDTKKPVHLVLRSDLAKGPRSLLKNQKLVLRVLEKFSKRFRITIYEKAICGNHIHCLVKAKTRHELQNFFRVFAGQVAQEILRAYPLQKSERGGTPKAWGCQKNLRTFWSLLLYSRVVSWGREFKSVRAYVILNIKEALGLMPYKKRRARFAGNLQ